MLLSLHSHLFLSKQLLLLSGHHVLELKLPGSGGEGRRGNGDRMGSLLVVLGNALSLQGQAFVRLAGDISIGVLST